MSVVCIARQHDEQDVEFEISYFKTLTPHHFREYINP